jgi:hypothetical protein
MAVTGGLTEIIATTLRHRSGKLADNVTNNNALLQRLSTKGNIKPVSGGRTIVQEIEYAENGTYTRYSGYETLNISPSDVITGAEFDWKQAAVAVTMSGLEMLQNAGKEAVIDLLESRISNAERTFKNQISTDIYSDGTASGGKQIGGLQLLIADTGLSTVGGISSTTYSWWRNQVYDFSTAGVTPSSATIQTAMNTLYMQTARGTDVPDLIVADNTYFRYYLESLQSIQRITSDKSASAGFKSLAFMGSDVVLDGGQDGAAPASHMYFINSNYLYFRPHRERNMVPLDSDRYATNQDAVVKLIGFAGNMTVANRALQGVIVA